MDAAHLAELIRGTEPGSMINRLAHARLQDRLQAARAVLWHYGDHNLGLEAGGFITTILQAFDRADHENFQRLAVAFPVYADLVREVKYGDIEKVRQIAKVAVL